MSCQLCVALSREYNVHVANGLITKARHVANRLAAHERNHSNR